MKLRDTIRRYTAVIADCAVYALALLLADTALMLGRGAHTAWPGIPPDVLAMALLTFATIVLFAGLHLMPPAPSVAREALRSAPLLGVATGISCIVTAVFTAQVHWVLLALPIWAVVLPLRSAMRVCLSSFLTVTTPASSPGAPADVGLSSTHLYELMRALAGRMVEASGVACCRVFTVSRDGGALVLRGARCTAHSSAAGKCAPSMTRLRIPTTELPDVERLLSGIDWIELEPAAEGAARTDGLARLLCESDAHGAVALLPLHIGDGPVCIICVALRPRDGLRTRQRRLRAVREIFDQHRDAVERALRLRALGPVESLDWRLLRDLPYGVVLTNHACRVVAVNQAAAAALGAAGEGLTGRRLCAGDESCPCALHRAMRTDRHVRSRVGAVFGSAPAAVGERTAEIWPVRGRGPLLDFMVIALAPEQAAATASAPEPFGAEIAALMSHELRAPLATLRASSELALEDDIPAEYQRQLLTKISRQVNRLDQLVDELVDVFRLRDGILQLASQPVDLVTLCREVAAERRAAGTHTIRVRPLGSIPLVQGDRAKLRTVLNNLVGNAVKYSPEGSNVELRIAAGPDEVTVSVQDEGPGIPREHLPRIFEKYYRVHDGPGAPKGTGLGLFITRSLVELHHGRLWAESEPGQGSCFSFALPRRPAPAGADAPALPAPDHLLIAPPTSVRIDDARAARADAPRDENLVTGGVLTSGDDAS